MKTKHLLMTLLALLSLSGAAWGQAGKQKEGKIKYYRLDESVIFQEFDDDHLLIEGAKCVSSPGFLVFPNYITLTRDGEEYVIFKYPGFTNGVQTETRSPEEKAEDPENLPVQSIQGKNGKKIGMKLSEFEKLNKTPIYFRNYKSVDLATGFLTIPFKLRPKTNDDDSFLMSTDVALGPYLGLHWRTHKTKPHFISLVANGGLTYINLNNHTTTTEFQATAPTTNMTPGVSLSAGLIWQLDDFSLGVVTGWDWASGVGDDWKYQGKNWISFAIGFSFLKPDEKN